ncbi:hypothetical protein C8J57DRAFT_1240766 [Mycena rebaudengoi]|nr:hypothetical protein C8J57DRAFT_1240766 [Mycena rebaudengoi]
MFGCGGVYDMTPTLKARQWHHNDIIGAWVSYKSIKYVLAALRRKNGVPSGRTRYRLGGATAEESGGGRWKEEVERERCGARAGSRCRARTRGAGQERPGRRERRYGAVRLLHGAQDEQRMGNVEREEVCAVEATSFPHTRLGRSRTPKDKGAYESELRGENNGVGRRRGCSTNPSRKGVEVCTPPGRTSTARGAVQGSHGHGAWILGYIGAEGAVKAMVGVATDWACGTWKVCV